MSSQRTLKHTMDLEERKDEEVRLNIRERNLKV